MFSRSFKVGYFILEGVNSFATTYFFYFFYFYLQTQHGFGNMANLAVAAMNGCSCALGAFYGGRFAERFGYFRALKVGFGLLILGISGAWLLNSKPLGMVLVQSLAMIGMCFTWPTFEALVSHDEDRAGLQWMVGMYNIVWAGTAAVAYFVGGFMLERLGMSSLFYIPISLHAAQLAYTLWLERKAASRITFGAGESFEPVPTTADADSDPAATHPHEGANPKAFLRMAWLANPLAYVALNTLVAVMPGIASRLEISTMLAGFCGSVWLFARFAGFVLLWFWPGWHYRFRWMLLAYIALVASFALILMVPSVAVLIASQLFFGLALGLIYYSSLFYAMDLGDAKGEHGGMHEAVIGVGNFTGPAVGAASLWLWPHYANSGALAVTVLLFAGLGGLLGIWRRSREDH